MAFNKFRRKWLLDKELNEYGFDYDELEEIEPGDMACKYYVDQCFNLLNDIHALEKAGEQGNIIAIDEIIEMYFDGRSVEQSYEKAFSWMKKALASGDDSHSYLMALCYFEGKGTKKDDELAAYWLDFYLHECDDEGYVEEAVELAKKLNLSDLGMSLYKAGTEAEEEGDFETAMNCYRSSALQGNRRAMFVLYDRYHHGFGVGRNDEKAFLWLKRAADSGLEEAYYPLALRYYEGNDPIHSIDSAKEWAQKAIEDCVNDRAAARRFLQQFED